MFTIKSRVAEIYSCSVADSDFKQFRLEGIKGDGIYDWLDEMDFVGGGITGNDFIFTFDDDLEIHTLKVLAGHFDVLIRPVLDLTESVNDQLQKLVIVEYSKSNDREIDLTIKDKSRVSFEFQQVVFGGDWELTLVFPIVDNNFIDLSESITLEAFSGLVISKKLGHHEVVIE